MAQISNTNLKHIVDKMARFALLANGTALATAIATGSPYAATALTGGLAIADADVLTQMVTLTTGFTDQDQQNDFVPPSVYIQENTPQLLQYLYSFWVGMRNALNAHMARYSINQMIAGDQSPLDAALRVINAGGITVRVHSAFQQYFGGISPNNVFTGTPLVLGTVTITGASAGTFSSAGTPTVGFCGPGQIAMENTAAEGLTSTTITLSCLQAGGTAQTNTWTVATTTINQLTAVTDTSQTYVSVAAQTPTITGGNATDTFNVVLLPDRLIVAA